MAAPVVCFSLAADSGEVKSFHDVLQCTGSNAIPEKESDLRVECDVVRVRLFEGTNHTKFESTVWWKPGRFIFHGADGEDMQGEAVGMFFDVTKSGDRSQYGEALILIDGHHHTKNKKQTLVLMLLNRLVLINTNVPGCYLTTMISGTRVLSTYREQGNVSP